jgi:biopolymer transport protein ExbB
MFASLQKTLIAACLSLGLFSASLQAQTAPASATGAATVAQVTSPMSPAAPSAPAAAVAANPEAAAHAADENPYGLKAVWEQGDMVAKLTLLILVVMSMGSWYVIFTKYFEQAKISRQFQATTKTLWSQGSMREHADALQAGSPYRYIAEQAIEGAAKHTQLLGAIDFNAWTASVVNRAMGHVQSRLQDGLALLATVGSTAPFVGLFGTVWGIYNALVKIGMSGQASIDKVAGPVGESLIMTAVGLAVAVPAVLGYNWLVRRNKGVMEEVHAFGGDLHAVLLASSLKK